MPGIAGVISRRVAHECETLVRAMVGSMKQESFYVSGRYHAEEMGVYCGWVAHDKSFAASQVFLNEQKDVALIFSGECFMDNEIGTCLKQKGHRLEKDKGDWLVHLYEEEGNQFFEKLNGLFSGLLIDKRQRKAFLFNDRYGIERIYYYEAEGEFYFASEAKALLRILPELRAFDEEGVAQFLTYGCTLEWRTLFRGIQLLPGGSVWSFEGGNCHKRKYFSPETWELQPILTAEEFESKFQETFKRILPRYFEYESRIGISLTGGLDTRMIMACRRKAAERPVCYTFSGESGQTLDDRLAARVAKVCGLDHRLLRLDPDFFSDFASHVDRTVYVTDGCFGVLGAHEIYLNRQARQLALVRLTGNYGSEVLRGVSTFKPLGLSPNLFNPEFRHSVPFSTRSVASGKEHPVTSAAFREVPWNLFGSLAAGRSQVTFRTPYLDNKIVALAYQVPGTLRASPLPMVNLVKDNAPSLYNIPTDMGEMGKTRCLACPIGRFYSKAMFKLDYLNNGGFPHWLSPLDPLFQGLASRLKIVGLHKYLHYRSWFRRELAGYVKDVLTDTRTQQSPFWNPDFLKNMAKDHLRGRKNYVREINAVFTVEAIERLFFRDLQYEMSGPTNSWAKSLQEEPLLTR